jgi:hypothetical protein
MKASVVEQLQQHGFTLAALGRHLGVSRQYMWKVKHEQARLNPKQTAILLSLLRAVKRVLDP